MSTKKKQNEEMIATTDSTASLFSADLYELVQKYFPHISEFKNSETAETISAPFKHVKGIIVETCPNRDNNDGYFCVKVIYTGVHGEEISNYITVTKF